MKQAYLNFTNKMNAHLLKDDDMFLRMHARLSTAIQTSRARRQYIDIDIDINGDHQAHRHFERPVSDNSVCVKTKSGYHILVPVKEMNRELHTLIVNTHEIVSQRGGECQINGNAMVPLPGTMQSNHLVEIV